MVKKRDVINSSPQKKLDNVLDLQRFKAHRERGSLATVKAPDEAVRDLLAWLPTMEEMEASPTSGTKMLRIKGFDDRTFFAIASNSNPKASSFFGAESADGTIRSVGALEWFVVGRFVPGKPPAVIRQSDLEAIAASNGRGTSLSFVSTVKRMVKQRGLLN